MRRYRIGRSETNDIVIPDASVSRNHAEVVALGDARFTLSDLGSTFGTHVWQDQAWVAAKETEIRPDTVIRFGDFRTTLMDILSESERAALGLVPAKPATPSAPAAPPPEPPRPSAPPPAAASTPAPSPRTAAPSPEPRAAAAASAPPPAASPSPASAPAPTPASTTTPARPPTVAPAAAQRDAPRVALRRGPTAGGKRRALVLGLMAVGAFFGIAAGVIALVLAFGDPGGSKPARDPGTTLAAGAEKFLAACQDDWKIDERRCRCFLAAAGPYLEPTDYDDFADLLDAHLDGDATRMESVLQHVAESRGAAANTRLSAAMRGVTRDCQQ